MDKRNQASLWNSRILVLGRHFLILLAALTVCLPASTISQTCLSNGDINQDGNITASDALLAFQHALGIADPPLNDCQLTLADVYPVPTAPDGQITASDALCIFQKALGLPSCLDVLPPSNQPPVANAGPDQTVDAGSVVMLTGSGSSDSDGEIAGVQWEQIDGRPEVSLSNQNGLLASFVAPEGDAAVTLAFRLTVTDNDGVQASDEVQVTVRRVNQPPAAEWGFTSVSAGLAHTCGIRVTGTVECWGWDEYGQSSPPAGTFVSVSAGGSHTCGIRPTGTVECWGNEELLQFAPTPTGVFDSISAGGIHTCGIRPTGTVECWGDNRYAQRLAPTGMFATISAGTYHTCGVRDTGAVEC